MPIYFVAVLLGSAVGLLLPDSASALEMLIWPVVGTLLYFTFLQVPLLQFRQALADVRFLGAILTANFIFVPLVVWMLLKVLPPSPPILLGVALVFARDAQTAVAAPRSGRLDRFPLAAKSNSHRLTGHRGSTANFVDSFSYLPNHELFAVRPFPCGFKFPVKRPSLPFPIMYNLSNMSLHCRATNNDTCRTL